MRADRPAAWLERLDLELEAERGRWAPEAEPALARRIDRPPTAVWEVVAA